MTLGHLLLLLLLLCFSDRKKRLKTTTGLILIPPLSPSPLLPHIRPPRRQEEDERRQDRREENGRHSCKYGSTHQEFLSLSLSYFFFLRPSFAADCGRNESSSGWLSRIIKKLFGKTQVKVGDDDGTRWSRGSWKRQR